jgi:hypothetical protein
MKLYTEEQVKKAIEMSRSSYNFFTTPFIYSEHEVIQQLKSIELPTDEEIDKANPFVFGSKHLGTRDMDIWELGAKWMRDKIQGGNK